MKRNKNRFTEILWFIFKFVSSVGGGLCDYLSRAPRSLARPLIPADQPLWVSEKLLTNHTNTYSLGLKTIFRFCNRVLRRVFGPQRDEVTGEWRKLHNEELNDLYSLPNSVRVVKSRRMRWAGHVALWGRIELCTGCWWGSLRERGHWGDQDVDRG
jgi:hypothetical protein